MTDLEISKALALAIGWEPNLTLTYPSNIVVWYDDGYDADWEQFDYRDWNVISPIAEKFNVFPYKADEKLYGGGWLTMHASRSYETPQKAIAMAVIGGEL